MMKTLFYNIGYFRKEAAKTVGLNPLSNLFSLLGTGLILFLLGMVMMGWSVGNHMIDSLQKEAEISAYFEQGIGREQAEALVDEIKRVDGVREAALIEEEEAQNRMKEILGEEAHILELFDENPFEAFIEVRIDLDLMDSVLKNVKEQKEIEYVRDNREVLEQIRNLTEGIKRFGYLVILAVGITTMIIISHMIRQGIYHNKEHINTLRLLGAPNSFIGFPYLLSGLFLTLLGGLLAVALLRLLLESGYHQLGGAIPFIPLPTKEELFGNSASFVIMISALLGLFGSLFGLSSIKPNDTK
jgi:cell division transport system permease protein